MYRRVRSPAVAGLFYPSEKEELESLIRSLFLSRRGPGDFYIERYRGRRLLGLIQPHAGYVYSGEIAAHGYAALLSSGLKRRIVIVGPDHYGLGGVASVYPGDAWLTPLGEVPIDREAVDILLGHGGYLSPGEEGHLKEHSIEVQLPILQYIYRMEGKGFIFTPISMGLQTINVAEDVAQALYSVWRSLGEEVVFIASTDFTHYTSAEEARRRDSYSLDAIKSLDPEGLMDAVYNRGSTMCGYGPTAALLILARMVGDVDVEILRYGHSGEVTGDDSNVVAYASIALWIGG